MRHDHIKGNSLRMLSWKDVDVPGNADAESEMPISRWARVVHCSRVDLDAATSSLQSERVAGGGHVAMIEGARCRTTQDLFDTFAESLAFPTYFGGNWDAFDECLADLLVVDDGGLGAEFGDRSGIPAKHLVVVIANADLVLGLDRDRTQEQRKFIGALRWAASGRAGDDRQRGLQLAQITVLFHSPPEAADELAGWLSEAHVSRLPVLELGGHGDG